MLINEIDQVDDAADYQTGHPEFEELTLEGDSGEQIELIAPRMELVPETVPWLQRKETVRYMGADFSGWSEEELTRRINLETETQRMREIIDDEKALNWYIRCDGRVIGNVNISSIATIDGVKSGVMAILIGDPAYWGRKIARRVNRKVIDWAFSKGGFTTLKARIVEQNVGSIKSFESLGFRPVGTEVEGVLDGEPMNWRIYAVDRAGWQTGPDRAD